MSKNETNAMRAAGSIAKRSVMGLALVTTLLVAAPQEASAQEAVAAPPPPAPVQYHSPAQRTAGKVLIGTGAASLVGFGVVTAISAYAWQNYERQNGGFLFLFVGLPLLGAGLLETGIGIPLYLNGSKPANTGMNAPAPVALSVGVGPQSASLKVTF
jgi:hypothetical protein